MRNNQRKPINLVTSDQSEIESDNSEMEIQQSPSQKQRTIIQDQYNKFMNSNHFQFNSSLINYANDINNFLQQNKKILFIFGPSGCGKSSLVKKVLNHNNLRYQYLSEQQEYNDQQQSVKTIAQVILHKLKGMNTNLIYVCQDFPIVIQNQKWSQKYTREFKNSFSDAIKSTPSKMIFVLNSQIYNKYYVLNQRAPNNQDLSRSSLVQVITMKQYGKTQMKKILNLFVQYQKLYDHYRFVTDKNQLEEILQLSNGDIRKAKNLIYWRGLEVKSQKNLKKQKEKVKQYKRPSNIVTNQFDKMSIKSQSQKTIFMDLQEQSLKTPSISNKSNKSDSWMYFEQKKKQPLKTIQKQSPYGQFLRYRDPSDQRVGLYHGLGKFLYAKRLNIKSYPKNKKDASCYYNQKQIRQLDPPFYFDPLSIYQNMRVSLQIFSRLLQQNYIQRFGKIKDVRQICNIFQMIDSFFNYQNKIQDVETQQIKVKLLTWGMLICNKNSRVDNKAFCQIQKSQIANVTKKAKQKQKLIRQYFPEHKWKDLVIFAHYTKLSRKPLLVTKTIFDQQIGRQNFTRMDENFKNMTQQQQQYIEELQKTKANTIQKQLRKMMLQKQKQNNDVLAVLDQLDDDDEMVSDIENDDDDQ